MKCIQSVAAAATAAAHKCIQVMDVLYVANTLYWMASSVFISLSFVRKQIGHLLHLHNTEIDTNEIYPAKFVVSSVQHQFLLMF